MKKLFWFLWAGFIVVAAVACVAFRNGIQDPIINSATLKEHSVEVYEAQQRQPDSVSDQDILVNTVEELEESSVLIIRCQPEKDRLVRENNVLTKVKVLEVIKGDKTIENKEIDVFEPISFMIRTKAVIANKGYNYMQDGKEYLLFLKKRKLIDGYKEQDSAFILTDELLGKYCSNEKIELLPEESSDRFSLADVSEYAVLTSNEETLEMYSQFTNRILQIY